MSSAKANQGTVEIIKSGCYLLGRPYNHKGKPCGHFIPLPNYAATVTITDSDSKTAEHKGSEVTTIPVTGLVVSNKDGLLEYPNPEIGLKGTPFLFQDRDSSNRQAKALFFPSHIIPMAHASYQGYWLKKLHSVLKENIDLSYASDVQLQSQSRVNLKEFFSRPDVSAKDQSSIDYAQWYNRQFSGDNSEHLMTFIEVPQLYTIVVVFSSKMYDGATVCLSQFPKTLSFAGSEDDSSSIKKATSIVKEIEYLDHTKTKKTIFAATFWLEGNLPQQLKPSEQYCRFDVDLSTVSKRENKDKIRELKIPHSYNLMEQVLHLPISTIAGRTTLVNGDPISVEEALVNHCPQYFKELTDKITDSAYLKAENVKLSNGHTAPEGVWHHLQTYKSFYGGVANSIEKKGTVGTISQLINASISQFDPDSELVKFIQSATGVSGAASGYLDMYKTFEESNPQNIGKLAKVVNGLAKIVNFNDHLDRLGALYTFPEHLQPFASKIGKVFGSVLDKPVSILELGYNMHNALEKTDASTKAETKFFNTSKLYTTNTSSFSSVLSGIDREQSENKRKAIRNAKSNLDQAISNGEKQNTLTRTKATAGDNEAQLLSLSFKFNSSNIVLGDEGQAIINEIVEFLALVDPTPIHITGHACRLGSSDYNNKIAQLRADTFADLLGQGLNGKVDDDVLSVWKQQMKTISMGENNPIDKGSSEESLAKNRRVEVIFMFNRYVQNPPCRSGMLALEASRKGAVAASVSEDKAWIDAAKSGLDLAVGFGAALMGPATIFAYSCYVAEGMLTPALSGLERALNKNANYLNDLKRFAEFDIAGQNLLLQQDYLLSPSAFMNKAYLKRGLALNGLIRLIHRYYYEKEAVFDFSNHYSREIRPHNNRTKSFDDYDIGGYIRHFLLRDDWSIGNDLFAVHLDEYWLDQKGSAVSYSSFASWIGGTAYVWNRMWQEEHSEKQLAIGQKYQQHLPIHYMSSPNIDYFKSLFATEPLKFDDQSIVKSLIISARPRGSDGEWQLLKEYLDGQHHRCLSPYDQIRVLVVLNKDNGKLAEALKTSESSGAPIILPIAIRAVKYNLFINDKASPTIGYATDLNRSSLCKHELNLVDGDGLFGTIINPTFSLGRNVIAGTRPMAEYENGLLKALFDDNNGLKNNHYNTPAQVYSMRYFYECYIPGSDDTEQPVHLNKDKDRYYFNLRLDPKREYKLRDKRNDSDYSVQDDYHFYTKNFLEADTIEQSKVIYPRVFEATKMEFSVYQDGKRYVSKELFDWDKPTEIELVVRTVSQVAEKLKNHGFEQNSLPIKVLFGSAYEITQAKTLHRIGKIDKKADKWVFVEVGNLDKKLGYLAGKYKKMTSENLQKLSIENKPTDIFAFHVSMSYINAVGAPQEGLKPFGYRRGGIFGSNNPYTDIELKVSSGEGAGLDNVATNNKISFSRLGKYESIPTNWITYNKDDEGLARKALDAHDSSVDARRYEGEIIDRKLTKLMTWVKAENDKARQNDIIDAWMLGKS